jgi:hypothetical protein
LHRSSLAVRDAWGLDRACVQRDICSCAMVKQAASNLPALVDAFVQTINSQPRELQTVDEVPAFLRSNDGMGSLPPTLEGRCTGWHIVKCDNSARIDALQGRTGKPFPPSFQYFLANYSFPAFEFGSLMFFANTGEDTYWELEHRLVRDPHMSPQLLRAGFLQIGDPFFYNYDPVCFDCKSPSIEKRVVQLDHEAILLHGDMKVVKEIAPSFLDFVRAASR